VATNRDLRREVTEGKFRQDLYYRVNVLPIHSPPLRDRIGDLPLLINMLLGRFSIASNSERQLRFDSEALKLLRRYKWPGNIRELENIIERLALTVGENGIISGPDVRCDLQFNGLADSARYQYLEPEERDEPKELIISRELKCLKGSVVSGRQYERQELEFYLRQIARCGGNLAEAARQLKIKRTALHMRINRLRKKTGHQS